MLNAVFPSAAEREHVIKAYRADQARSRTLSRPAQHLAAHLASVSP